MSIPDWVLKFREPKTEIKRIGTGYYKYAVDYRYNPAKKRTDKITGVLLGKITQKDGFVASDKNQIRASLAKKHIDIKSYGVYKMFSVLLDDEWNELNKLFSKDVCEVLFSFAMFRWAHNSPIKRAPYFFNHDYCSEVFSINTVSDKIFSSALKTVGEERTSVVEWMKSLLGKSSPKGLEFVMMDSTHVHSKSDLLTVNAKGYNPNFNFERQIRLMYLFSAQMQKPVYYRLINGNITDIKSMALCVKEMKVDNVIYIADKGFYSKENIGLMKDEGLQYIIPLHRNNGLINYRPLQQEDFKKKLSYFIYNERIIWYYAYQGTELKMITFLDESLRANEESDYAARIISMPETHTKEKFIEKLSGFGTLTFTYHIKSPKTFEEIYSAYKQRNEVEIIFDSYKNFLSADVMYMQNRYVLEGWLLANFIAMLAYHKLFIRLKEINKLSKYSPKDIIEMAKSIYKLKINDEWKVSEIPKKTVDLFKKLKIDYLN